MRRLPSSLAPRSARSSSAYASPPPPDTSMFVVCILDDADARRRGFSHRIAIELKLIFVGCTI